MRPELEESFDEFVRKRAKHFRRVAVLLTGSPTEAEDLLQAGMIRLYQAWPRLGVSESAPDAYLRKILVNTQRSWWQVKWRQESPVAVVPDRPDPAHGADPADGYALGALVRSVLARLPRQQRAVLVLRYIEDLPEASVADLLGVSVGTVKTHAHRGLRALRASLGDLGPFGVNEAAGQEGARKGAQR